MLIGIVTREYAGISSYAGGVGVKFARLAPEFVRQGHEVHVVTLAPGASGRFEHKGVTLHTLTGDSTQAPLGLPRLMCRALRAAYPLDLVYAPEWGGDAWRYAQAKERAPLVTNLTTSLEQVLEVSAHASRPLGRHAVREAVQRRRERIQTERSDGLVALSRAVLSSSRELWDLDGIPTTTVPNGIVLEEARAAGAGPAPAGFPEDGPIVVFPGRLEERKGTHVLAAAMPLVWAEIPQARLVTLGQDTRFRGDSMSRLLERELGGPRLHVLGPQGTEQVLAGIARANVVAIPSLWEAFGNVAVESLALGRPVVYTGGSGFDDIFTDGENGLAVPPGEPEPLAGQIVRVLQDAELARRLGAAATERSRAFEVHDVAFRLVRFFEEIVAAAKA